MKFSYNWLKELSGTKKSPEQLAELLTMKAFEVEGVNKLGNNLESVVVGKILEINKHPNADKLQLTKVDVETKKLDIVCGAWNIKVGDMVPVALVGTKLPNGMEIKEAEIRGEKSFGMLCAEDELGLGKDHNGIIILDKNAKIGENAAKALGLDDTLMEIDVLANRGHDALSHVGMAREICAIENRQYNHLEVRLPSKKSRILQVEIKDNKLCSRYIGVVINNIKIGQSPMWMQNKLRAVGLRPINNIVDATNYIMLETGQPMHAFDNEKLKAKSGKLDIIVRRAKSGEKIKLLDETEKELTIDDLVIANESKALALAGIMGGEDSGISSDTETIVLEAANFNAQAIRKTRQRLGLMTDSSLRFEKEIDPNLAELAMARAVQIISAMGGKTEGVVDIYPTKVKPWKIKLDLGYVNRLLGENIPPSMVKKILNSLELKTAGNGGNITVAIPTFRIDLKTQEDLIEEIGRIYGYEKIKPLSPMAPVKTAPTNEQRSFERVIRRILVGSGFSEVYNYSFYSQKNANLAELGSIKHLELENPANPDQQLMRVSLVPGLLKNIAENLKRYKELEIFEIGRVYWPAFAKVSVGKINNETLPEEKRILIGAMVLETKEKETKKKDSIFYEIKGCADILLKRLGFDDYYYDTFDAVPSDTPLSLWHEGRSAQIKIEGTENKIGFIGEINPLVLINFDIHERVAIFEFDLEELREVSQQEREYLPIRRYPEVLRDISMVTQGNILVDEILQAIQKAGGNLVLDTDLFDIFDFEDGSSSYAFHIIFGADRTLINEEVDHLMEKISNSLEKDLGIKIRK
jgi:phenylalanyl-tRNA synthetase beta chain